MRYVLNNVILYEQDSLTAVVHDMLLGALYATSACVMFGATVYFAAKRSETFEAAQRITGPVSFIVKYSRCGEPVNLYLRLGLASTSTPSTPRMCISILAFGRTLRESWS